MEQYGVSFPHHFHIYFCQKTVRTFAIVGMSWVQISTKLNDVHSLIVATCDQGVHAVIDQLLHCYSY